MRPPRPGTNCRRADWCGGPACYHRIRQVSEVPLLLRSVIFASLLPFASSPPRTPSSTPRRTATIYPSKGTSSSTSFRPNRSTASSFAPSIVPRMRLPTHNTLVCSLARWSAWASPPLPISSRVRGPMPTTRSLAGVPYSLLGFGFSLSFLWKVLGRRVLVLFGLVSSWSWCYSVL
jgi:hypothetical protein